MLLALKQMVIKKAKVFLIQDEILFSSVQYASVSTVTGQKVDNVCMLNNTEYLVPFI